MTHDRVISFIDGFNLYHAIHRLKRPELKWLNLKALSQGFVKSKSEKLERTLYFSAHAVHMPEAVQGRQKAYIRALELQGVEPMLGHFKKKDRRCPDCSHKWVGHEEKETDVNIALTLLDLAYQDKFDRALLISNDSDLAPAIKMVRERFPEKRISTIAPPHSFHSNELIQVSSEKSKITLQQLERSLLPLEVPDYKRLTIVSCPREYIPSDKSAFVYNRLSENAANLPEFKITLY